LDRLAYTKNRSSHLGKSSEFSERASEVCGDEFGDFWLHSAATANTNVPRPNILFILSDEHRPGALEPG
jgi:hypothetical protein